MFNKLFGKREKFFAQLADDAKDSAEQAKETVVAKIGEAKDAVADQVGGVQEAVAAKVGEAKDAVADKVADNGKVEQPTIEPDPVTEAAKPTKSSKSKKTSVKDRQKAPSEEPQQPLATPTTPTSILTAKKEEPKEIEFATKYLIDPPKPRRYGGPSLDPFRNMARQVKVPKGRA